MFVTHAAGARLQHTLGAAQTRTGLALGKAGYPLGITEQSMARLSSSQDLYVLQKITPGLRGTSVLVTSLAVELAPVLCI